MRTVKVDLHNHLANREFVSGINFKNLFSKVVSPRLGEEGIFGIIDWGDTRADRAFDEIKKAYGSDITDLNCALYIPQQKLWVVRGQEVPARVNGKEVHFLVVGLPYGCALSQQKPLSDMFNMVSNLSRELGYELIVGIDEPFHVHGIGPQLMDSPDLRAEVFHNCHAYEVFNKAIQFGFIHKPFSSYLPKGSNEKALAYYNGYIKWKYPHIGLTEGSDSHSQRGAAGAYFEMEWPTVVQQNLTPPDFLGNLRKGIQGNRTYSGRAPQSALETLSHAGMIAWDHVLMPRLRNAIGR